MYKKIDIISVLLSVLLFVSTSCGYSQKEIKFIPLKIANREELEEDGTKRPYLKILNFLVVNSKHENTAAKIDSFVYKAIDSSLKYKYRYFFITFYKETEFLNEEYLKEHPLTTDKFLTIESIIYTYTWDDYGKTFRKRKLVDGVQVAPKEVDTLKIEMKELLPKKLD